MKKLGIIHTVSLYRHYFICKIQMPSADYDNFKILFKSEFINCCFTSRRDVCVFGAPYHLALKNLL